MAKKNDNQKQPKTMEVEVANTKDLQVQSNAGGPLQASGPNQMDMGEQGFDASDLLLPRILLMQSQSDLVSDGKASPGDLVNSLTGDLLGNGKSPLELIPLFCPPKTWVTSEKAPGKGKPKFKKIQSEAQILAEYGKTNTKDIPWEETLPNGLLRLNKRTLNFYVLVRRELEAGEGFPYLISFQSTAYNTGKKIATHFMKCGMLRTAPHSRSLKLVVNTVKGEDGNYQSPDIMGGEKLPDALVAAAAEWLPIVKSANVRVDSAEKEEASSVPAAGTPQFDEKDLSY